MRYPVRAAVAALVALGLGACSNSHSGHELGAEDGKAGTESPTPSDSGTAEVFDLDLGDCVHNLENAARVSEVVKVPCEQEHSQEVYAIVEVPEGDGSFPGPEAFEAQAHQDCVAAFQEFVGVAYDDSTLDVKWLEPSRDSWASGDRELVCTVVDPAGPVTGTLRGAAR